MQPHIFDLATANIASFFHNTFAQRFLLILAFYGCTNWVAAQTIPIQVKVTTATTDHVSYASIKATLGNTKETVQALTDSTGTATLILQQGRTYQLTVSAVTFETAQRTITPTADSTTFFIQLHPASTTLGNVVVSASRPLMRQEDDKTIVDPENLAAASTNSYEIMEKIPGLFVDQDGNIYLNSTTPATVHINGREQKMSASDIATMLKSLPPNAIASIEILRTPSARYDASGGGGIVNVILRKGVRIGLTGSINAGFNQGRYGNQFTGINLTNNNGNLSTYLNLQYSQRNSYEQVQTSRLFSADSILKQDAFTRNPANTIYAGFGASLQVNKKWEVSYDGRVNFNRSQNRSTNLSEKEKVSTGAVSTRNRAEVANRGRNSNLTQSLALKYKLDSTGSEWNTDFSYTNAPNHTTQNLQTIIELPASFAFEGDGDINNRLQFFSAQSSLLKKVGNGITLEGGVKTINVIFKNNTTYHNTRNGTRVKDNVRTGAYDYNENINSAFLQGSKTLSGIVLKVGTRLENTNMKGNQHLPLDTTFNLRRTDLFPYVYLSRNLMKIAGYDLRAYLVYRRTINRPAYGYLNPSIRIIDPYLIETGNPSLRPQFTQNYEANVSVNERPILAIGINETKDIFTQVIYPSDSSQSVAYRTYDNLGSNKETYFRVVGAIPPGKRYFFVVGAQYNHNFYNGLYESKPLAFKRGSWSVFTYQTLKLTPTTQFSLNGFARFNGQLQFYELSSFGALNMSLNQQLLNKKLTISLSGTDLFFTNNTTFTLKQGTVNASGLRKGDTRRFGVNLRYNFGIRKKEEPNMFNVESPERAAN